MHLLTAFTRLQKQNVHGFHAFRRFRITWLRDLGVPEDIIRYWVGHAGKDITDRYSKLAENVELRKEWALRAGLGFDISIMGHPAPRIPKKPRKPKPVANVAAPHAESKYVAKDEDLDPFFSTPVPVAEEV